MYIEKMWMFKWLTYLPLQSISPRRKLLVGVGGIVRMLTEGGSKSNNDLCQMPPTLQIPMKSQELVRQIWFWMLKTERRTENKTKNRTSNLEKIHLGRKNQLETFSNGKITDTKPQKGLYNNDGLKLYLESGK